MTSSCWLSTVDSPRDTGNREPEQGWRFLEMSRIVEVRPSDGYRIWLRFSDGAEGEVDLSDLAGRGVFAAWAEPNVFKAVRVEEGGGIEWPGEIDMCPDALYLRLTGKAVDEVFPGLEPTPVDA
jgi:hypothetical protein